MKVKQLIEELQKCNPEADVVVVEFDVIDVDKGMLSSSVISVGLEIDN